MKLRNKLVAVLAASMVVTSVPVVTMADTTNYVSTSRYAQKGTTYGYLEETIDDYTMIYGSQSGIGSSKVSEGYDYRYSNGFEFVPVNTYNQTDATYFALTADSEFNTKAMLTYVDAFNSANGKSYLAFDKDGKVVNANNPKYNGKTADDLLREGVQMYFKADLNSKVANPAFDSTKLVYDDIATQVATIFPKKVKEAGSALYTSINFKTLMDKIQAEIVSYVEANATTLKDKEGNVVKDKSGNEVKVVLIDAAKIATKAKDIIKAEKKELGIGEGGKITTSYAELYQASGEIVEDKLVKIIEETIAEVNTSVTAASYDEACKGDKEAYITIQKVDALNYKDANDREYKSHVRITSNSQFIKGVTYKVPILAKLGGDKQVLLDVRGNDSNITSCTRPLTQDALTGKRLSYEAASEKIRVNAADKIGEIKFTETQIKSLANGDKNRRIKIELKKSSDLEFNINKTESELTVTGLRGLYATNADKDSNAASEAKATIDDTVRESSSNEIAKVRIAYGQTSRRAYKDVDRQTLIIELPKWATETSIGELSLKGIYVQPTSETANAGDVEATISEYYNTGKDANGVDYHDNAKSADLIDSKTVKVGEVKEYDVTLKCDKAPSIKAGRSGIINDNKTTFVLEEVIKDSLVDGRKIKFTVENGYIFGPADIDDTKEAANGVAGYGYGSANYKQKALDKFNELLDNEKIKLEEKANNKDKDGIDRSSILLDIDAEGRVVGFSAIYPKLKDTEADKIKVTMPVAADVMAKGEVKVKAENLYTRSAQDKQEDPTAVIANVIEPIAVTFDGAKLKVGKQAQEAGTITIKETDKGMLQKGWIYFNADNQSGITFDAAPTVTVEGADAAKALVVKNVVLSKDKTMVGIEITRESTEASTIKISGINMTADRTVPEANYDLAIWGDALTDENELGISNFTQNALYNYRYFNQTSDLYLVKDFIQMTTVNTEDLIGAAKAVTTQFVIGQKSFTVNGETKSMEAAPYIKDGLTFVPVRYLADAFGVTGSAVQYDKASSTVTIIYGDKAVKMTNGKAVMTVNGTEMPMASKAEIGKDGRMYVPMAYIATAFGVEKSWDATTKTATFTNQK